MLTPSLRVPPAPHSDRGSPPQLGVQPPRRKLAVGQRPWDARAGTQQRAAWKVEDITPALSSRNFSWVCGRGFLALRPLLTPLPVLKCPASPSGCTPGSLLLQEARSGHLSQPTLATAALDQRGTVAITPRAARSHAARRFVRLFSCRTDCEVRGQLLKAGLHLLPGCPEAAGGGLAEIGHVTQERSRGAVTSLAAVGRGVTASSNSSFRLWKSFPFSLCLCRRSFSKDWFAVVGSKFSLPLFS